MAQWSGSCLQNSNLRFTVVITSCEKEDGLLYLLQFSHQHEATNMRMQYVNIQKVYRLVLQQSKCSKKCSLILLFFLPGPWQLIWNDQPCSKDVQAPASLIRKAVMGMNGPRSPAGRQTDFLPLPSPSTLPITAASAQTRSMVDPNGVKCVFLLSLFIFTRSQGQKTNKTTAENAPALTKGNSTRRGRACPVSEVLSRTTLLISTPKGRFGLFLEFSHLQF